MRLYYWFIRRRYFVKSILKNCYLCKLVLGKPVMPPSTPSLSDYRFHCMFPFQTIGVDFADLVYVRDVYSRCEEIFKCCCLLVTYAATESRILNLYLILEVIRQYLALRRCFSRRGTSSQIISDNFKTFKDVEIRDFLRFKRIQWEFILERFPWWGDLTNDQRGL